MNYDEANSVKHPAPRVMKVLEGLEWCIYKGDYSKNVRVFLITHYCKEKEGNPKATVEVVFGNNEGMEEFADEFTPILSWEEIERVLEKTGYVSIIHEHEDGYHAGFYIREKVIGEEFGKTRQEAVMLAIIKLGKELRDD